MSIGEHASQGFKFKFYAPRDSICEASRIAFSQQLGGEISGHSVDYTDQRLRFDIGNGCAGTRTRAVYDDSTTHLKCHMWRCPPSELTVMNNRHRGKVNDLVTITLVEGSQIPDSENEFGYAASIQGAHSRRSRIGMS